jgi:hypothetical protein
MPRRFRPSKPTPFKPFEDDSTAAYIYLLTNPAFRYVNIGYTRKPPKERAKALTSATGVPGEFKVGGDWFVPADLVRKLESGLVRSGGLRGYAVSSPGTALHALARYTWMQSV